MRRHAVGLGEGPSDTGGHRRRRGDGYGRLGADGAGHRADDLRVGQALFGLLEQLPATEPALLAARDIVATTARHKPLHANVDLALTRAGTARTVSRIRLQLRLGSPA
ncbi:hypothetical protein AB0N47_04275 [Streptomyces griseoluteus]